MLVPRDLGLPDLVLVVIFFFIVAPIVSFIIRRKWRIAAARKEEIMRLVVLASEEEARAELESSAEYGTIPVSVRQFQCAVCYCATTTRCSRCKAVRYCSGKCQIIHWRQGHKDECFPPSITVQFNDEGSSSGQKVEIEDRWCAEPLETFSEESASSKSSCSPDVSWRKDDQVEPLVVAKGRDDIFESDNIFESTGTSFLASFCAPASTNESLVNVSVCDVPTSSTLDSSDGPLPEDIFHDMLETTVNVNDTELSKSQPSEAIGLVDSVNSFSCPSKLKQKTPSFSAGEVHCGSTSPSSLSSSSTSASSTNGSDEYTISEPSKVSSDFLGGILDPRGSRNDANDDSGQSIFTEGGDRILSDSGSLLRFSFNMPGPPLSDVENSTSLGNKGSSNGAAPSEKIVTDVSKISSSPQYSEPRTHLSDVENPKSLRSKEFSYGAAENIVTDVSRISSLPPVNTENSDSIAIDRNNGSQLLKSRGISSTPASASNDNPSSCIGRHTIPSFRPTKVDILNTVPTCSSEIASSSPNASNVLKTSVRKVVQQFRVSKLSKHYPLGFGSEAAGKYNNKMLFPYELFIKLYHWDKVELRPCGLTNCGNSCYANAVLQCLAFTRPLTAYLLQGLHSKACPKKGWCFTCEFEGLILKAKEGKSLLSPIGILSQIQSIGSHLGHGREEDAHEFLRYAVDTMQSVCLKEAGANAVGPLAEETTLMGLIFGGYLRSKIKCMKCQGKSERHERMMDLTVEIHGDIGTLEEALAQFTATEILDGENKYQCSRCKSYEKAKKKLTVLEAPNVLTIALKRFQSGKFGKLNKSVRFPEILNLAPYMSGTSDKSPVYQLYAVVVHLDVMNAAFSGHYVCYVKNSQGKWFKIDDSTVKPVELERVLSKGAYMLLYARCSPRAPSLTRNIMINDGKIRRGRCSESVLSTHGGQSVLPKARLNSTISSAPIAHRSSNDYPHWMTPDGPTSFFNSDDGRFPQMHRILKVDSSSDNSSLFSCSDEGSCSTESTRDSTSTDDLSDYIFGEAGRNWNSPLRVSSDSDGSSSPLFSRSSPRVVLNGHMMHSTEMSGYATYSADAAVEADGVWKRLPQEDSRGEDLQGKGSSPFLYSDTTKHHRKLTNHSSSCSSCRDTDSERLGWVNPSNVKSSVSLRKLTRDRMAQTFY